MSEKQYDVLVAGGGLAGIAAAISSARLGVKTLFVERYGFLGGMATAGLVNTFMSHRTSTGVDLVAGVFSEICQRMRDMDGMQDMVFDAEAMKYAAQELVLESGTEILLHSCVTGVRVVGKQVTGLEIHTKTEQAVIDSQIIIDATGDGDVAAKVGVPFSKGDESRSLTQAMTLMSKMGGVDLKSALHYAKDHPEQMRFPKPVSDEQIDNMLEGVVSIAGYYDKVEDARREGKFSIPQDMVFFISLPHPGQVVVNTTHIGGLDPTDSADLTKAEIEGRRQVIHLAKFMREYIPGFENSYLLQTAAQIGVREARRIHGEYTFTSEDVRRAAKFPDAILRSAYPVDIHSSIGKGYSREEDISKHAAPPPGDWYEVPYRCLVPLGIENLLIAGRCISSTYEGHGAIRIMPSCIAMGQAAGTAAALCALNGTTPRLLDITLLKSTLRKFGALV